MFSEKKKKRLEWKGSLGGELPALLEGGGSPSFGRRRRWMTSTNGNINQSDFNVINTTPSVIAGHHGSQILVVPLVNICIFSLNASNLNLYVASEGESPVILAGNEGRQIFIRINGELFIAETGNVHCLKRTGIRLFTWLSKNKTEYTAKCTCSFQNLTSAQAKLLHWDKLFLCLVGATERTKKQKSVFLLKGFYSEMDEWLSTKRKPRPPKEQGLFFFLNCFAPWSEENYLQK